MEESGNIPVTSSDDDNAAKAISCSHRLVSRRVIREGDRRSDRPRFGATGRVSLDVVSCSGGGLTEDDLSGDFFYSKYFNRAHSGEVQVGNADSELDKALELCVRAMRPGEKCEAVLAATLDLAKNGRAPQEDCGSPPVLELEVRCEVTLETLLNAQPVHRWYAETKFDKAREANSAAIRLFKLKRTLDAFHKFHLTLTLITFVLDEADAAKRKNNKAKSASEKQEEVSDKVRRQAEEMSLTCHSNLAACHFQWGNHASVSKLATVVLGKQPDNVKLLYRRGVANLEMKDFEASRRDLVEAHRLDPTNKAINDKMGALRLQEKKHRGQLAGGIKKMFA